MTREFIVNEGNVPSPTIFTYIQSLSETLSNMRPKTQSESQRIAIARQHLKEIKRNARKLQEQVSVLQEKLSVLEESKEEQV
tara:strand:- start:273 stop:518 length:246 start_codon:yes stop_codon:yes gene_type:complete